MYIHGTKTVYDKNRKMSRKLRVKIYTAHDNNKGKMSTFFTQCISDPLKRCGVSFIHYLVCNVNPVDGDLW